MKDDDYCILHTKRDIDTARKLPQGVYETPSGNLQVRVWYQSSQRHIGTFQTLEQAKLASEVVQNMFKNDKGLQLSPEVCERNIKLAKEAASASCAKRDRGRPTKANQTVQEAETSKPLNSVDDERVTAAIEAAPSGEVVLKGVSDWSTKEEKDYCI